uniref:Uncharacterized protein n=1 Tax=Clytia hemisphaerica TaxID=252671 RepID=A0A7M5V2H3_9CNID
MMISPRLFICLVFLATAYSACLNDREADTTIGAGNVKKAFNEDQEQIARVVSQTNVENSLINNSGKLVNKDVKSASKANIQSPGKKESTNIDEEDSSVLTKDELSKKGDCMCIYNNLICGNHRVGFCQDRRHGRKRDSELTKKGDCMCMYNNLICGNRRVGFCQDRRHGRKRDSELTKKGDCMCMYNNLICGNRRVGFCQHRRHGRKRDSELTKKSGGCVCIYNNLICGGQMLGFCQDRRNGRRTADSAGNDIGEFKRSDCMCFHNELLCGGHRIGFCQEH